MGKFISVAGNIGVGKTTAAKLIKNSLGFRLYEESVEDNPYLTDFYKDIKSEVKDSKHAYDLQTYFLFDRAVTHRKMSKSIESCVQDRSIYEDRYIFAEKLANDGIIGKTNFEKYKKFFDLALEDLIYPNTMVFLDANLNILKERIINRGRKNEKILTEINNNYLEELQEYYYRWARNYKGNLLIIDTNELNLKNNQNDKKEFINLIKEKIKN